MVWQSPVRRWEEWEGETRHGEPAHDLLRKAWVNGNLAYKLNPNQLEVYQAIRRAWARAKSAPARIYGLDISRQYGKDFLCALICLEELYRAARRRQAGRIPYGAPTQDAVKELLVPTLVELFVDCPPELLPLELRDGTFTQSAKSLTLPTRERQRLRFVGLDLYPDRMRGSRSLGFCISEGGFVEKLDYVLKQVVMPQLMHSPQGWGLMNSTPPITMSHVWCREWLPKLEADDRCAHRTIDDNPMLTEEQKQGMIDELGGPESDIVRRELYAEKIPDPTITVLPEWRDTVNVVERKQPDYCHCYIQVDPGINHLCGIVAGWYDFEAAVLYIRAAKGLAHANTEKVAAAINEIREQDWFKDSTYYDGQGFRKQPFRMLSGSDDLRLIVDLNELHGIQVAPEGNDGKEAAFNNARIAVSKARIQVHPEAKEAVAHLKYGVYKRPGSFDLAESGDFGHFDLLASSVRMWRAVQRKLNPFPPSYIFVNRDESFVNEERITLNKRVTSGMQQLAIGSRGGVIKRKDAAA